MANPYPAGTFQGLCLEAPNQTPGTLPGALTHIVAFGPGILALAETVVFCPEKVIASIARRGMVGLRRAYGECHEKVYGNGLGKSRSTATSPNVNVICNGAERR